MFHKGASAPFYLCTGVGGLTLTWQGNYAHIQGKVTADQVGKTITISATVKDMSATTVSGTNLVGTWTV